MRRSSQVIAPLLATAAALLLTGCGPEMQRCVYGGSYSPEDGHSYSLTSGTGRGGFGSFFSGGEGE